MNYKILNLVQDQTKFSKCLNQFIISKFTNNVNNRYKKILPVHNSQEKKYILQRELILKLY